MKTFICPNCWDKKELGDKKVLVICRACICEMKEIKREDGNTKR